MITSADIHVLNIVNHRSYSLMIVLILEMLVYILHDLYYNTLLFCKQFHSNEEDVADHGM